MTNSVSVAVSAGPYAVGQPMAVTGAVVPATDAVQIQLSASNATLPSGPWYATTLAAGAFAGTLTPVAPGTWYAWAYDPATGVQAVSGALVVPVAALSTVSAVPVPQSVVATLLGGAAAGDTPDQLPAAAPAGDTDTAIVAQSGKVLFAQTFAAIWTWVQGHLPGYLLPQVNIATNVNLTNSAHNGRILSVTATGVTITALLASLGPGFTATLFNDSGSTVAVSGITLSTGTTIAANGVVELFGRTVAGNLVIWGRVI